MRRKGRSLNNTRVLRFLLVCCLGLLAACARSGPGGSTTESPGANSKTTITYSDFGSDIKIEPPM